MRKTAFIQSLDTDKLTPPELESLGKLAALILKFRGGQPKGTADIVPAIAVLSAANPDFTVDHATLLKLVPIAHFLDIIHERGLGPTKQTPHNPKIHTFLPGSYFATTATDAQGILSFFSETQYQTHGETHLVINLGEQPGFEFKQLRELLLSNDQNLIDAAGQRAPNAVKLLGTALPSLRRAKLHFPNFAVIQLKQATTPRFTDLLGVIDSQLHSSPTLVTPDKLKALGLAFRQKLTPKGLRTPNKAGPEIFRNKEIVMSGTPPRGWSTDRFNALLKPVKAKIVSAITPAVKFIFYNPQNAPKDQLDQAERWNLQMVPYESAIYTLTTY